MKTNINIYGVNIAYTNNNITIYDSYKIDSPIAMYLLLETFRIRTNYAGKRTIRSWITEWTAHNRLYKLGLFKKHTKDCDLSENESKLRLFIYNIIGRFKYGRNK